MLRSISALGSLSMRFHPSPTSNTFHFHLLDSICTFPLEKLQCENNYSHNKIATTSIQGSWQCAIDSVWVCIVQGYGIQTVSIET